MAAPPITERHLMHFHRRVPVKELVRAATTANITIATALNNGDSLDGVTLADGDRVLVKNQGTDSQNGIYVVGATPVRDYDLSTDDPAFGFLVVVLQGSANAGTIWRNTNTASPTVGSTPITFEKAAVNAGPVTTSGLTMATARLLGRTTASTGAIEEITVGSGLTLSAGSLTATGSGAGTVNTADDGTTTVTDPDTISITGSGGIAVTVTESPSGTAAYDIDGSGISGSGGLSASVLGYDTAGASNVAASDTVMRMKKVTLSVTSYLQYIGAYIDMHTLAGTAGLVAFFADSSGSPTGAPLAMNTFATTAGNPGLAFDATDTPSWFDVPIGGSYAAGDYWIVFWLMYQASNWRYYYDGSGTDKEVTTGAGGYLEGISRMTVASASRKYSLRLGILS